jgi:hypothetical protein
MVWVREQTIPTERPPLVGEVIANFFRIKVCHLVSLTDPYGRILDFLDRSLYFSLKYLLSCTHEAEWAPFQTHYFFFLIVPGIELGPPDLLKLTLQNSTRHVTASTPLTNNAHHFFKYSAFVTQQDRCLCSMSLWLNLVFHSCGACYHVIYQDEL